MQSSQVKSATRTLDIIEYVIAHDRPLVAQEIAVALNIPVSSLSYLLATLVERGYLARDGRRYSSGPVLERLQTRSIGFSIGERAAPLVRSLRSAFNETASFFIRHEWDVEAIVTETSEQALRYSIEIGKRLPMHAMASGKALLAVMEPDELDRYFAESQRDTFTPFTVTSEQALRDELKQVRQTGFALADEEFSAGICGIGRAVVIKGEPAGSFSMAIPKARWSESLRTRIEEMMEQTVALLEHP